MDANQKQIIAAFRKMGVFVRAMHAVGEGFPDLYVAVHGYSVLVEIKDGDKPPSAQELTPEQVKFHAECPGPLHVVRGVDDVVRVVNTMRWAQARLVA